MDILNVFYNFNQGGVERLGVTVANYMAECTQNESHVCIITEDYSDKLISTFSPKVHLLFLKKDKSLRKISYAKQLVSYIKKNNIQIMHVHQGELMPLYATVKLSCPDLRVFLTVHDTYIFSGLSSLNKLLSVKICSKIIAISNAVVDDIKKNKINTDKIVRIYNGVDFNEFKSDTKLKKKRTSCTRISNVARFFPEKKGQDILIEAAGVLKKSGIDFMIRFAGAEPYGVTGELERMRRLAEDIGVSDKIEFLGNVDNVTELLSETDIFCIPSRYEGFGISAVEALAMGIPCVASNIPGLNEVIASKKLGELFESENSADLADKIIKVLTNIDAYDPQRIREDVYNRFSVDIMVKQLEITYGGNL